jgi:hypothetical protein
MPDRQFPVGGFSCQNKGAIMKHSLIILTALFIAGCVQSKITEIRCNEVAPELCQELGGRIFKIDCSSSNYWVDANAVRNSCLKDIAKHVNKMGFEYFATPDDIGNSYSQNYTYTTNQAITTHHDYNAATNSDISVYGSGRAAGYSAYGTGNSNTRLSGTSTSYVPVQQNYTQTTHQRTMSFVPLYDNELSMTPKYYRVSDYL